MKVLCWPIVGLKFFLGWDDKDDLEKVAEQDIGVVDYKGFEVHKNIIPSHFQKSFGALCS